MFTQETLESIKKATIARINKLKNETYPDDTEALWEYLSMPECGGKREEFFERQDALIEQGLDADDDTGEECAAFWLTLQAYSDDELAALIDDSDIPTAEELALEE